MADVQEQEKRKKNKQERQAAMRRHLWNAEQYWYPNREESHGEGKWWNAGDYFTTRLWGTDDISKYLTSYLHAANVYSL
jgi:hypothetical protein